METKDKSIRIIADTSVLISLAITSDSNHQHALTIARYLVKETCVIVLPVEVLAETINLLGKKFDRVQAITTGRKLNQDERFIIVDTNRALRSRALEIMEEVAKSVSYTDCLVIATAEAFKTNFIFGFDDLFRKRGYHLPDK